MKSNWWFFFLSVDTYSSKVHTQKPVEDLIRLSPVVHNWTVRHTSTTCKRTLLSAYNDRPTICNDWWRRQKTIANDNRSRRKGWKATTDDRQVDEQHWWLAASTADNSSYNFLPRLVKGAQILGLSLGSGTPPLALKWAPHPKGPPLRPSKHLT